MARACSICTHERRADIDAAIAAGKPYRAIGRDFGVGNDAVSRHAAAHMPGATKQAEQPPVLPGPPAPPGPVAERAEANATAVAVPVADEKPAKPSDIQSRARGVPTSIAAPELSIATDSATPRSDSAAPSEPTATAPETPPAEPKPPSRQLESARDRRRGPDDPDLPPCPPDRAGRVEAIEDIMLALRWEKGKTGPRLAAAWGLTLSAVESYSAEASRNIVRNADPQAMRAKLATTLDRAIQQAVLTGELKALASLAKTYADMLGLIQSSKVQVNVLQAPPVQEFAGAVATLLAALCPEHGDTVEAWLADVDRDVDGARSDPAGWLERRRGAVTVEAEP